MFIINEDKSIYITRGDVAFFSVATETEDGEAFKFHSGDVVRFKVFEKKACENVVLQKDFGIEEDTEEALIYLEEKDTKIGGVISKPVDYWYEVELNPYTDPQTIIGYDEDGAKIFKLYPEGNEAEDDEPITPEDIPVVDEELDLTSTRPVQNQAISRAILKIRDDVEARMNTLQEDVHSGLADARGQKVTNVAEPEEETDAATKKYVDGKDAETKKYADDKDAETKQYVDDKDAEIKQYVDDAFAIEDISSDFLAPPQGIEPNYGWIVRAYKCGNVVHGQISASNVNVKYYESLFRINNKYRPKLNPIFVVYRNDSSGYNLNYETSMIPVMTGTINETLIYSSADYNQTGTLIINFLYMCA